MAVNDRYFGPAALEAARGASPSGSGWPEYNGGILMPKRSPVALDRFIYRFANSKTPHRQRAFGSWWIEYEAFAMIRRFIRESGGTRRDSLRYLLALPWSWSGVVGFQKEGTLYSQNLSPLTCPLA